VRHSIIIGVRAESIGAVTHAISGLTGWAFEPHDSSYLGEYDLFHAPERLKVKYNFVDAQGEWDFPEHPDLRVLIVVEETNRPEFFQQFAANLGFQVATIRDKPW